MLADLLRGSICPALWASGVLAEPLVPWQSEVAQAFTKGQKRIAVSAHRQAGKSHLATVLLGWIIAHRPGSTCLLISQDQRAASEILARCRDLLLTACPHLQPSSDSATRLDLRPEAGRIVSLPATSTAVRGWARPDVVFVDEAGFVDDAVFAALTAVLARSNAGQLLAVSTPRPGSSTSWFSRALLDPELADYWLRFRYSVHDTALLGPSFLEAEQASMTDQSWAAEYLADPAIALEGSPFTPEMLAAAAVDDIQPWNLKRKTPPQ